MTRITTAGPGGRRPPISLQDALSPCRPTKSFRVPRGASTGRRAGTSG